jgi:hypothetical protein
MMYRLVLLILLASCSDFLSPRCGPDVRSTALEAVIRDPGGAILGRVHAGIAEKTSGPFPRVFGITFNGPQNDPGPLLGHVTRVRLIERSGELIRNISFKEGNQTLFILTTNQFDFAPGELEQLRDAFRHSEVILEILTDLPGLAEIRTPMKLVVATGFERQRCATT